MIRNHSPLETADFLAVDPETKLLCRRFSKKTSKFFFYPDYLSVFRIEKQICSFIYGETLRLTIMFRDLLTFSLVNIPIHYLRKSGIFLKENPFVSWVPFHFANPKSTKQMEVKLNFQVPAEGLELVILYYIHSTKLWGIIK